MDYPREKKDGKGTPDALFSEEKKAYGKEKVYEI